METISETYLHIRGERETQDSRRSGSLSLKSGLALAYLVSGPFYSLKDYWGFYKEILFMWAMSIDIYYIRNETISKIFINLAKIINCLHVNKFLNRINILKQL